MSMRTLLVLVLLGGHASGDTKPKAAPDKFAKAAGKLFADALAAAENGQLSQARALYEKSFEISPHPSTAYNLADVVVRDGRIDDGLVYFRLYLAMAPGAPDREDVRRVIGELESRPGTLEVIPDADSADDLSDAYVLVDGDIAVRPGQVKAGASTSFTVPRGSHTIDVVTAISYVSYTQDVTRGARSQVRIKLPPRVDGNVILSTRHPIMFRLEGRADKVWTQRMVAKPGRRMAEVEDSQWECSPVTLTAPTGDSVAYAHVVPVELPELTTVEDRPHRCRTIAVRQHTLQF